jgi:hypothetical protein
MASPCAQAYPGVGSCPRAEREQIMVPAHGDHHMSDAGSRRVPVMEGLTYVPVGTDRFRAQVIAEACLAAGSRVELLTSDDSRTYMSDGGYSHTAFSCVTPTSSE